jgi:hypothetical protein
MGVPSGPGASVHASRPAALVTEPRLFLSITPRRSLVRRHPDLRHLLARVLLAALYVVVIVGAFIAGHGGL